MQFYSVFHNLCWPCCWKARKDLIESCVALSILFYSFIYFVIHVDPFKGSQESSLLSSSDFLAL